MRPAKVRLGLSKLHMLAQAMAAVLASPCGPVYWFSENWKIACRALARCQGLRNALVMLYG
jgi:hypothetical protein